MAGSGERGSPLAGRPVRTPADVLGTGKQSFAIPWPSTVQLNVLLGADGPAGFSQHECTGVTDPVLQESKAGGRDTVGRYAMCSIGHGQRGDRRRASFTGR